MPRLGRSERRTRETTITASWDLDRATGGVIDTGIGFFDHMLDQLARHSGTCLAVQARGDLQVDPHHTTEDSGLALGQCLREALGDRAGCTRFGEATVPLDEALVQAVVDLSGRPFLACDLRVAALHLGTWDSELVVEFLRAFADQARLTLHVRQLAGSNSHHVVEACFKAVARALRQAIALGPDSGIPSTKGVLG